MDGNTIQTPALVPEPVAPVAENTDVSNGTPPAGVDPVTTPPVTPTQPQYMTREDAQKLFEEALNRGKEVGRREMQSQKDAEIAWEQRRVKQYEQELSAITSTIGEQDPDLKERLELSQYRAREQNRKVQDAEIAQLEENARFRTNFYNSLTEHAREMGIDPTNKELDWGREDEAPLIIQNKFNKSVAKIVKAQMENEKKRHQDEIINWRKQNGLESVDKTPASIPITQTQIPTNRAELGKFVENLSDAEYAKLKPKITQMINEGKIK